MYSYNTKVNLSIHINFIKFNKRLNSVLRIVIYR